MTQEVFISMLEVLEKWFELDIINLEDYFKIKSNICDLYREKNKIKENGDLPF